MTIVDELHSNFAEILAKLPAEEISLRSVAADSFRKGLLLSAASLFEKRLTELVAELVRRWGGNNAALNEFVRIKAIERQYHTYFDWDCSNAKKFFGLFGDDFKAFMAKRCTANPELGVAMRAFLELGRDRNRLVHQDFGAFVLEKTAEEIFDLYQKALGFVDALPACFADFSRAAEGEPSAAVDSQ
jgi:hypothetical protein